MTFTGHICWSFSPTPLLSFNLVSLIVSVISLRSSNSLLTYCILSINIICCKADQKTHRPRTEARIYSRWPNQWSSLRYHWSNYHGTNGGHDNCSTFHHITLETKCQGRRLAAPSPSEKGITETNGTAMMNKTVDETFKQRLKPSLRKDMLLSMRATYHIY